MSLIVPAVLPSSRKDLDEKLALLMRIPRVKRIQIDVVDEKFATPASFPYNEPSTKSDLMLGKMLPELERVAYEIDLMCFDPLRAADAWLARGATRLTFHTESSPDLPHLFAEARSRFGSLVTFGLALNIESSFGLAVPCMGELAYVQFMGIAKPGRQGEPFDERVLERIATFRRMYPDMPLQVDGGVSLANAKQLRALGVTDLVVGSGILKAENPAAALAAFEALQSPFGV